MCKAPVSCFQDASRSKVITTTGESPQLSKGQGKLSRNLAVRPKSVYEYLCVCWTGVRHAEPFPHKKSPKTSSYLPPKENTAPLQTGEEGCRDTNWLAECSG